MTNVVRGDSSVDTVGGKISTIEGDGLEISYREDLIVTSSRRGGIFLYKDRRVVYIYACHFESFPG